jgi:4-hydroxy-2-oxoglutarate aldolase
MLLEGLYIPLTTPFHSDGRLNPSKLASNIARYSKTPAVGLILLGPQSEPTLLSDEETHELLRTAAQAAAPEKVLIANISRDSVHSALALANFAAAQHYDAVLIGAPSILTVETPRELLIYFQTIADHSPLPIVLLNTPSRCIPIDATIKLAAHPNIIALLDTPHPSGIETILKHTSTIQHEITVTPTFTAVTARMLHAASTPRASLISAASLTGVTAVAEPSPTSPPLRTRIKTVGFQILAGAPSTLLESLRSGASGIAPAFAACAPQACYEVFAAWKDSDQPLAEEKQARLHKAARLAEDILGPGGLKFGCDRNGYFGGLPRLPYLSPTGQQRAQLENLMQGMRN